MREIQIWWFFFRFTPQWVDYVCLWPLMGPGMNAGWSGSKAESLSSWKCNNVLVHHLNPGFCVYMQHQHSQHRPKVLIMSYEGVSSRLLIDSMKRRSTCQISFRSDSSDRCCAIRALRRTPDISVWNLNNFICFLRHVSPKPTDVKLLRKNVSVSRLDEAYSSSSPNTRLCGSRRARSRQPSTIC